MLPSRSKTSLSPNLILLFKPKAPIKTMGLQYNLTLTKFKISLICDNSRVNPLRTSHNLTPLSSNNYLRTLNSLKLPSRLLLLTQARTTLKASMKILRFSPFNKDRLRNLSKTSLNNLNLSIFLLDSLGNHRQTVIYLILICLLSLETPHNRLMNSFIHRVRCQEINPSY